MKKLLLLFSVVVMLAGCQGDKETSAEPEKPITEGDTEPATKETEKKEPKKEPEKQDDDKLLTKVGEVENSQDGRVELMRITSVNKVYNIKPIKMTIKNVKVMDYSDVPKRMQAPEKFTGLQILYTLENTSEKSIEFTLPIKKVILSNGLQLDVLDDGYIQGFTDTFYGKVKLKLQGTAVILPDDVNYKNLKWIEIITGETATEEDFEIISDAQRIKIKL
jgi:hypothetical protein